MLSTGSRTPYALTGAEAVLAVLAVLALARACGVDATCHITQSISIGSSATGKADTSQHLIGNQLIGIRISKNHVDLTVPRAEEGLGPACAICSVRGGLTDDAGLDWNPGGGVSVTAATFTAVAFGLGLGVSTTGALVGTAAESCRE